MEKFVVWGCLPSPLSPSPLPISHPLSPSPSPLNFYPLLPTSVSHAGLRRGQRPCYYRDSRLYLTGIIGGKGVHPQISIERKAGHKHTTNYLRLLLRYKLQPIKTPRKKNDTTINTLQVSAPYSTTERTPTDK